MEVNDDEVARHVKQYAALEMLLAMLVVKYGTPVAGCGHRLAINAEDAFALVRQIGSADPVVMHTFEAPQMRYVIDVL